MRPIENVVEVFGLVCPGDIVGTWAGLMLMDLVDVL